MIIYFIKYHLIKLYVIILRFNGFTDEWKTNKIDDVCIFVRDGTHGSFKDVENGIPLLSAKDISDGKINIHEDSRCISIDDYNAIHKKYELEMGDILLTIVGTIGRTAMIDNSMKFTLQRSVAILRTKNDVSNNFVYYYMQSSSFQKRLKSVVNQSAQGGVYLNSLKKLKILISNDFNEQKKISDCLIEIDKKIELLEKKYQKYVDFKKYLMQQIFSGKLRFDYEEYSLKEICEKIENGFSGTQVSYKTEFPVTRIETISSGKINYEKVGFVDEISERFKLKKGDILLTNINSLKWIGNAVYYGGEQQLYHGMNLMLLRTKKEFNSKYLYYYISYNNKWFKKMACQAVNQASINKTTLEKFKIKFPSITDQNNISNVLTLTDEKIHSIQNKIELTNKFKKGLLQQMFI